MISPDQRNQLKELVFDADPRLMTLFNSEEAIDKTAVISLVTAKLENDSVKIE